MSDYPIVLEFKVKINWIFKITVPVKITLSQDDVLKIQKATGGILGEDAIVMILQAFALSRQ